MDLLYVCMTWGKVSQVVSLQYEPGLTPAVELFLQLQGGTSASQSGHDRKAALNEADLAGCGDVGDWLGVDSGARAAKVLPSAFTNPKPFSPSSSRDIFQSFELRFPRASRLEPT